MLSLRGSLEVGASDKTDVTSNSGTEQFGDFLQAAAVLEEICHYTPDVVPVGQPQQAGSSLNHPDRFLHGTTSLLSYAATVLHGTT